MRMQIGLALLLLAMATPARAQEADARWAPWLGCWQLLHERVREGNPEGANAVAAAAGERALGVTSDISVCVAPTPRPDAVTLTTRAANEPVLEQTLVADGRDQSMSEAGCTGTQRAEWSREGRRLFAHAELACAGQPARTVSGIATIAGDGTWIDVQAMEINGRANVRVRRFQRRAGQRRAGASWTVEDIKEASAKVSPAALEAALIESDARLPLSSRSLVALDEANVPDGVIDLLVALSHPEKFQIERRAEASLDLYAPGYAGAAWSGYSGYGFGYPYLSGYQDYYGNYGYYVSPFSYGYYGLYGGYPGYSGYYPGSAITIGVDPVPPQDSGNGRVINGVGYTRVRPREAQTADSDGGRSGTASSGRATSGGYSQGSGSSTSSSDGGSSGGSSSGSSGGSSSGGSSGGSDGGGGRTAQPR
jgi:hypothetical protein